MPLVRFLGTLTPGHIRIDFNHREPVLWPEPDLNLELAFTIDMAGGAVRVDCEASWWDDGLLVFVHRRAFELARAPVNVLSFVWGVAVSVQLDRFISHNGEERWLQFDDPRLPQLVTAAGRDMQDVGQIVTLVSSDPRIMIALNDIIESIKKPHVAVVNCGRVVETLRRIVCPPPETDRESWARFRRDLRLSQNFVQAVTDVSRMPRHGDWSFIPGDVTSEAVRRTWVIMNRFLEFKKRGGVAPLPLEGFPEI